VVGFPSLDVLAFPARTARRTICAVLDAKRGEVFSAFYRPVPGGVSREGGFEVGPPDRLRADLEARPENVLLVGNGALVYRRELEGAGSHLEFATAAFAFPQASALVELAVPRIQREEYGRLEDVLPIYVRKSDAEIAWDRRRGAG
jgi:tRNA threonylcarbamoyladenosine biosynthesis protein TsaB